MDSEKTDIILVNPSGFHNLIYNFFNLGLLSSATYLKDNGFSVFCLDLKWFFMPPKEDLINFILSKKPIAVGFYTIADNMFMVSEAAGLIKKRAPETKIILGGPEATVKDSELLKESIYDFAVRNEGEITLLELMKNLKNSSVNINDIKGITYKKEGRIIKNPDRDFIKDLDALPSPDHDLLGGPGYVYPLVTGRGCPYNCIFCYEKATGKKFRYRSVEKTFEEIINGLEKYKLKAFSIFDDTFVSDVKRAKDILRRLIKFRNEKKADFIFFCEARADILFQDKELAELLKEAGLKRLQIGVESGNQGILNAFKKGITIEQIKRSIKLVYEAGIPSVVGNFILGAPGESKDTIRKSIEFAKELMDIAPGVFEATSSFLVPYPGTEIEKKYEKYKLKPLNTGFLTGSTMQIPHFETEFLNKAELIEYKIKFDSSVFEYMKSKISSVKEEHISEHIFLAKNHRLSTNYYLNFYSKMPVLESCNNFMISGRFFELSEINNDKWELYHPFRVIEDISYDEKLNIRLQGSVEEFIIEDDLEKLIFILSSGRNMMTDIAQLVKKRFSTEKTAEQIFFEILLPFYKKFVKSKYIIFYL